MADLVIVLDCHCLFLLFPLIPMGEANQLESLITTAEQTQTVLSRSVARKPEIQDELQLTNLSVSEYEDLILRLVIYFWH